ncbi:hypothetical protein CCAX7_000290 [Capsulimonas corticalis]|uniref:Uncharacterized protein n=1 Tax=Capsulimonas corticalis TaxID=2219043 RepID=A0A402CR52_9BACT|nr:hypothetical protein [Capsulimonas corticalis]BDI27978.1 hypothetical protein CCAX7_000290 [Capsulimonas corticalis]
MSNYSDNFHRTDTTAGGAGSTSGAGNGWIDVQGGIWSITGNSLIGVADTLPGGAYARDFLLRPASESCLDQQILCEILGQPDNQRANYLILRYQDISHYYSLGFNRGVNSSILFNIAKFENGALIYLASQVINGVIGHAYRMVFTAIGATPTALTGTLIDMTAASVVGSLNASDSTTSLQAAGQSGLSIFADTSISLVTLTDRSPLNLAVSQVY